MKYLFIMAVVAAAYLVLGKQAPVQPVKAALSNAEAAPLVAGSHPVTAPEGSALKRPLDRTHAVLEQQSARASEEF